MEIKEYIELNYPNTKATHYNILCQLKGYFKFIKIKPNEYVKSERDFKTDIKRYNGYLLNTPRPRTGKPYAPKSVAVYISCIRGFLEEHDITFSPRFWKRLTLKGKGKDSILEDRIPTREEIEKILIHGDARDKAFFLSMLSSGMREEELCGITINNIDFNSNPVMIKIPANISKTKKKRFTFISVEAKNALHEWLKIRENYIEAKRSKTKGLYNYLNKTYNRKVNDEISNKVFPYLPITVRTGWNRLLRKAGFDKKDANTNYHVIHLYTLRKYFSTKMKKNANIIMVEMWMGHTVKFDYEKWTVDEHKEEYTKASDVLLIYKTPANIEEMEKLKTSLKEEKDKVRQVDDLKQKLEEQRLQFEHDLLQRDSDIEKYQKMTDKKIDELTKIITG